MTNPPTTSRGHERGTRRRLSKWRMAARGLRLSLLLVFLSLTALIWHLHEAGLPEFVKSRIVQSLRAKGWDADFSRVRLRWERGIVVEDLQVHATNRLRGFNLFVDEAQCELDRGALLNFNLRVAGLSMEGGRILWPLLATNGPKRFLRLEELNGDLVFKPRNEWELRRLTASSFDARFQFSGTITNAEAMRNWDFSRPEPEDPNRFLARWRRWMSLAEELEFAGVPEVQCRFSGDARDLESFEGTVSIQASGMKSPWVSGTNIAIEAEWSPAHPGADPVQAELTLSTWNAVTPWGQAEELKFYAHGLPSFDGWIPTNINMAVEVRRARTRWGQATFAVLTGNSLVNPTNTATRQTQITAMLENLRTPWASGLQIQFDGAAVHPLTNAFPATVSAEARAREVDTRWGRAGHAVLEGVSVLPREHRLAETNLVWPERLAGTVMDFSGTLTNLSARDVRAGHVVFATDWAAGRLGLEARGRMADGDFEAVVGLDADTREVEFRGSSTIDPQGIKSLLTTNGQRWLARYSWVDPPRARASGRLILPEWTERQPDWKGDVRPTIEMAGEFEVGPAAYRGAEFRSARSPFTLTNLVWKMTDLHVTRPEGDVTGQYESHLVDRDFHWQIEGSIYPHTFLPLLEGPRQRHVFELVRFSGPPAFRGEIDGNWKDLAALSFSGHVLATNFMFRGEPLEYVEGDVEMRDRKISVYQPKGRRVENETAAASGLMIDLETQKLHLTNLFARVSAEPATRIISEKAHEIMQPYVFETPPVLHVEGIVDIKKGRQEYDLDFEITGSGFHWRDFHFNDVSGDLRWLDQTLLMTNMTGGFHGGRAWGNAYFDFSLPEGARFDFQARVTNVNFHTFTADLSAKTNDLEGILSGRMVVTDAYSEDWKSWQGYGDVYLEDGLIWDIPVFGVFSPILNTIAPGLGNSRARSATATYAISNSVIRTDDLAVNATAMRMQFRGASDFERRIEGRMEAELLRNMPAVGAVISKVLWPVTKLFEYKINGTLQEPKTEPVYIFPKIILLPLNPLRSLREIFLEPAGSEQEGRLLEGER